MTSGTIKLEKFFKEYEKANGLCLETFEDDEDENLFTQLLGNFVEIEKEINQYKNIEQNT